MSKKPIETGLVVAGTAKFGRLLLEKAAERNEQELQRKVVDFIAQKLTQIEEQRGFIDRAQRTLECFEAQVEALKAGQFTIDKSGSLKFNDTELAKQLECMVRCAQCGYQKLVIGPN